MNASILDFSRHKLERQARRILRERKLGRMKQSLTSDELDGLIEAIKRLDPDHPILPYLERANAPTKLDAS